MRLLTKILLTLAVAALAACGGGEGNRMASMSTSANASAPASGAAQGGGGGADMKNVHEPIEEPAQPQQQGDAPVERKIIRDADITLEVEQPAKAMQRVTSIAEARGGFVVTSDSRQQTGANGGRAYEVVTVQMRVPAAQFDAALADIRGAGGWSVTLMVEKLDWFSRKRRRPSTRSISVRTLVSLS